MFSTANCKQGTISYEYETNVEKISTNSYLKHEVVENKVIANYACITYNEKGARKDICVRGGDPVYYESNQTILHSVENYFNALDYDLNYNNNKGYCTFTVSDSVCLSNFIYIDARSDGTTLVGDNDNRWRCTLNSDGLSYCWEQ